MKKSRNKNGRPPALDGESLIIGFALGRKLPLEVVAKLAGVSPTTVRKYYNSALLDSERLQDLARLIHDTETFG